MVNKIMMTEGIKSKYESLTQEFRINGFSLDPKFFKNVQKKLKKDFKLTSNPQILELCPSLISVIPDEWKANTTSIFNNEEQLKYFSKVNYQEKIFFPKKSPLPFKANQFDLILINPNREPLDSYLDLQDCFKILKPGGVICFISIFPEISEPYFSTADYLFAKVIGSDRVSSRALVHFPGIEKAGFSEYQKLNGKIKLSWTVKSYLAQISSIDSYKKHLGKYYPVFMSHFEKELINLSQNQSFNENNVVSAFMAKKP